VKYSFETFQRLIRFPRFSSHNLIPSLQSSPILRPSLFHSGTSSGVVRRRGGTGASVSWVTSPWSRRGPSVSSPALLRTPVPGGALSGSRVEQSTIDAKRSGMDENLKTPDRVRGFATHYQFQGRTTRPVFPDSHDAPVGAAKPGPALMGT
jgi:hypothetical protein